MYDADKFSTWQLPNQYCTKRKQIGAIRQLFFFCSSCLFVKMDRVEWGGKSKERVIWNEKNGFDFAGVGHSRFVSVGTKQKCMDK